MWETAAASRWLGAPLPSIPVPAAAGPGQPYFRDPAPGQALLLFFRALFISGYFNSRQERFSWELVFHLVLSHHR